MEKYEWYSMQQSQHELSNLPPGGYRSFFLSFLLFSFYNDYTPVDNQTERMRERDSLTDVFSFFSFLVLLDNEKFVRQTEKVKKNTW